MWVITANNRAREIEDYSECCLNIAALIQAKISFSVDVIKQPELFDELETTNATR